MHLVIFYRGSDGSAWKRKDFFLWYSWTHFFGRPFRSSPLVSLTVGSTIWTILVQVCSGHEIAVAVPGVGVVVVMVVVVVVGGGGGGGGGIGVGIGVGVGVGCWLLAVVVVARCV